MDKTAESLKLFEEKIEQWSKDVRDKPELFFALHAIHHALYVFRKRLEILDQSPAEAFAQVETLLKAD